MFAYRPDQESEGILLREHVDTGDGRGPGPRYEGHGGIPKSPSNESTLKHQHVEEAYREADRRYPSVVPAPLQRSWWGRFYGNLVDIVLIAFAGLFLCVYTERPS
jgi:hypothetical protein